MADNDEALRQARIEEARLQGEEPLPGSFGSEAERQAVIAGMAEEAPAPPPPAPEPPPAPAPTPEAAEPYRPATERELQQQVIESGAAKTRQQAAAVIASRRSVEYAGQRSPGEQISEVYPGDVSRAGEVFDEQGRPLVKVASESGKAVYLTADQVRAINTSGGETKFNEMVSAGVIDKGAVYTGEGIDGGVSYLPAQVVNTIRDSSRELYDVLINQGYDAFVKAMSTQVAVLEAEAERAGVTPVSDAIRLPDNVTVSRSDWYNLGEAGKKLNIDLHAIGLRDGFNAMMMALSTAQAPSGSGLTAGELVLSQQEYDQYVSASPEDKFGTLIAAGYLPEGSTYAGSDNEGNPLYYLPGETPEEATSVGMLAAETLIPFLYVARHWDELPDLPSVNFGEASPVAQAKYEAAERALETTLNRIDAENPGLSREDKATIAESTPEYIAYESALADWKASGGMSSPEFHLASKATYIAADIASLLPVLGWLGKAGVASATTASGVSKLGRAAQVGESVAYAARVFPKGVFYDFPKGLLTNPVATLKGLASITVEPIIHPVRTTKTIAGIVSGKIQLGNFIPEGTIVTASRTGRAIPLRTVTGEMLNVSMPATTPTTESGLRVNPNAQRDMLRLVDTGKISNKPLEGWPALDNASIAQRRIAAIEGAVYNYGFTEAVNRYGLKQVKIVFPSASGYLAAEARVQAVLAPERAASRARMTEKLTKFIGEQLYAEPITASEFKSSVTLGTPADQFIVERGPTGQVEYFRKGSVGTESDWARAARTGFLESPATEPSTRKAPTKAEALIELAQTPCTYAVVEGGAWRVEPLPGIPLDALKLRYPVYITDPAIISDIRKLRAGTIKAFGEMASPVGSEAEWNKLVAAGLIAEPSEQLTLEVPRPIAEIQTKTPMPIEPIKSALPTKELSRLLSNETVFIGQAPGVYTVAATGKVVALGSADKATQAEWLAAAIIDTVRNKGWGAALEEFGILPVLAVYPYAIEQAIAEEDASWSMSEDALREALSQLVNNERVIAAADALSPDVRAEVMRTIASMPKRFTEGEAPKIARPVSELPATEGELPSVETGAKTTTVTRTPVTRISGQTRTVTPVSLATTTLGGVYVTPQAPRIKTIQPITPLSGAGYFGSPAIAPGTFPYPKVREYEEPVAVPQPAPSPAPDVISEPFPTPEPAPVPTSVVAPVPEPVPEPVPSPIPEPVPEPIPEPTPEPTPVPAPAPEPVPEPIQVPIPEPAVPPTAPVPVPVPATLPVLLKVTAPGGQAKRVGRQRIPDGSITWAQGWDWKYIPPPYNQPKPISLGNNPPVGAVNTGSNRPRDTIQIIGSAEGVPSRVSVDLGWTDIEIINGNRIRFTDESGLYTDVGGGIPNTTQGMSVPGMTVGTGGGEVPVIDTDIDEDTDMVKEIVPMSDEQMAEQRAALPQPVEVTVTEEEVEEEVRPRKGRSRLNDLFEVPQPEDNDIYTDDLVTLSESDERELFGVGNLLSTKPKPKKVVRRVVRRSPPADSSMGGTQYA